MTYEPTEGDSDEGDNENNEYHESSDENGDD